MNEQEFYKYNEIEDHFYDYIEEHDKEWIEDNKDDLHNNAFNTDYYIIGTYQAKQWLGSKAFDIIGIVKDYEIDNFGEVTTDLSHAEKVVNMYAYIVGEYIVNDYLETSEEKQKIAV
tara:strand:+ start:1273 stop:1623 length:351 start_codon:yes stop_codon:yes gene_type:complete